MGGQGPFHIEYVRVVVHSVCLLEKDEIHILQHKSGVPVNIPLSATVGNAIFDYIQNERPKSENTQIFLCGYPPYDPISGDTMWVIAFTIYKAAGFGRQKISGVEHIFSDTIWQRI